jgi:lipopolysaccharide biosynthesis glycosyltransferase
MTAVHRSPEIRIFVVFEPSYAFGCLALLSSLARHASRQVAVDILMRRQYQSAADKIIGRLKSEYGERIILRRIIVPQEVLDQCEAYKFKAHFIPEVLFRLYYFDLVSEPCDYAVHLDLDMIVLGDIFSITQDLSPPALLHAVEDEFTPPSRRVSPPKITRYMNAGFMVFHAADRQSLRETMRKARQTVDEIAGAALFLDQDAINIAFYGRTNYLPCKWNYTLAHFKGHPIPADIVVLHATGSRKPWFFRGRHPFSAWYEKEADFLGLSASQRYDFWWAPRRFAKKAKGLLTG